MQFNITQEHVAEAYHRVFQTPCGEFGLCENCPVSLALKDILETEHVNTDAFTITVIPPNENRDFYRMNDILSAQVGSFSLRGTFIPGVYTIEVPVDS